jgi:hypothetical protein
MLQAAGVPAHFLAWKQWLYSSDETTPGLLAQTGTIPRLFFLVAKPVIVEQLQKFSLLQART